METSDERKQRRIEHGRRVRAARTVAGLTLSGLALELGVEKSTAARWDAGELTMGPQYVEALVQRHALGTEIRNWIVFGGKVPERVAAAFKEVCAEAERRERLKPRRKRAANGEARR